MFTALTEYLHVKGIDALQLSIALEGDGLRVTVNPYCTDAGRNEALTSLSLTGSASELETGFNQAISHFVTETHGLLEQVDAALEATRSAAQAKAKKGGSTPSKANGSSTPVSVTSKPPEPQGGLFANPATPTAPIEQPAKTETQLNLETKHGELEALKTQLETAARACGMDGAFLENGVLRPGLEHMPVGSQYLTISLEIQRLEKEVAP